MREDDTCDGKPGWNRYFQLIASPQRFATMRGHGANNRKAQRFLQSIHRHDQRWPSPPLLVADRGVSVDLDEIAFRKRHLQ